MTSAPVLPRERVLPSDMPLCGTALPAQISQGAVGGVTAVVPPAEVVFGMTESAGGGGVTGEGVGVGGGGGVVPPPAGDGDGVGEGAGGGGGVMVMLLTVTVI